MIVHTNIEKYTILYTIMHGPQICTINKRLVIAKKRQKLEEFQEYPRVYDDAMKEDITKRIDDMNDELATRQESIDLLKGRLKNQITSFKETTAKVLDKDTSLGEKIRTLFREQGITIASILTAIGMAIGVLVEALLPGGGGAAMA